MFNEFLVNKTEFSVIDFGQGHQVCDHENTHYFYTNIGKNPLKPLT